MEARINQQQEGNLLEHFKKSQSHVEYMNRVKVCQQNVDG